MTYLHHVLRSLCALALLAFPFSASAQITTASLEGTVHDSSGAVFARAQVSVINTDTNVATAVTTNSVGRFLALSLPPGNYRVTVAAPGFKLLDRQGIVLDVNQTLDLDLTMEV